MIPETTQPSGMMLADIGIFSGYKPDVASLNALAAEDNNLDMFELADKKVSAKPCRAGCFFFSSVQVQLHAPSLLSASSFFLVAAAGISLLESHHQLCLLR